MRHRDRVLARDEPRRVAVGIDERIGERPPVQPRNFAENLPHRRRVQVTVRTRIEHRVETENLEQVELEVAHVGSVMAHCVSAPRTRLAVFDRRCLSYCGRSVARPRCRRVAFTRQGCGWGASTALSALCASWPAPTR